MPSGPITLLLLLLHSTSRHTAGADDVLCYAEVNKESGGCEDYLGDGVPEEDCCLNIKYAFKRDEQSECQGCRPAEWSEWSEWSGCTVSCEEGIQDRRRICIGQGDCDGSEIEVKSCSLKDCCPEAGGWSEWTPWSQCSVTCAVGQRQRTRQCNNPPPVCDGECIGHDIETEECDTKQICPTHGSWGGWGLWNECSSSCTVEGSGIFPVQSRFRNCDNPPPSSIPPGRPCDGNGQETRDCRDVPLCEVDGQWGPWQVDSECSVTCGIGRIRERRSCDSPAPRNRGKECSGPSTRQIICNTKKPCPIVGHWSQWSEWTQCSRVKKEDIIRCKEKIAHQKRDRDCLGSSSDDYWCEGEYQERRKCYDMDQCFLPGKWTEWSEWGLCSSPCGESKKKRFRECSPLYPNYQNTVVGISRVEEVFFSGTPIPRCDAINGQKLKVVETTDCKNVPECP